MWIGNWQQPCRDSSSIETEGMVYGEVNSCEVESPVFYSQSIKFEKMVSDGVHGVHPTAKPCETKAETGHHTLDTMVSDVSDGVHFSTLDTINPTRTCRNCEFFITKDGVGNCAMHDWVIFDTHKPCVDWELATAL